MADGCESRDREYPSNVLDTCTMNRVLRHRLRNLCAGMTLALDSIADQVEDEYPRVVERAALMLAELQDVQRLTERMDLVFDELPHPQPSTLGELLASARAEFAQRFPFCALTMQAPEQDATLLYGSWWAMALDELLRNAGEAAGSDGQVGIACELGTRVDLTVTCTGCRWPGSIPVDPPEPFRTTRGRHDGLGLAIAKRLCAAMGADMAIDCSVPDTVTVNLTGPVEEETNG